MAWPYQIDMSTDSEVWDGTETISYYAKIVEAVPTNAVSVSGTLWLMIRKDMLPANSPLIGMDRTVELPGIVLAACEPPIVPKANDVMQRTDGTRWVIKLVEEPASVDYRVWVVKSTKTG